MNQDFKYCPQCASDLTEQIVHRETRLACSLNPEHYIHYNNPKPVVAAIIEYQGQVLLARNVKWPPNWFALVTGFLEKDESPEQGIIREVKEEVGLDAEVQGLVGVYPFFLRNEIIIAYHVKASGAIVLDEDIVDTKLIPKNEIIPWPYATGDALRDWLRSQGILDNIDKTLEFKR
ncbi:MAG: NUDIX domain-containing protein [Microscillaceae bacterium]|nr:NUDIX domain-containing protein [Microscillaceae bacterium]